MNSSSNKSRAAERGGRWDCMQRDMAASIFQHLNIMELLLLVPLVCRSWRAASLDPLCWSTLDMRLFADVKDYWHFSHPHDKGRPLMRVFKAAVDRCGAAVRCIIFSIFVSPTDEELEYIAQRTRNLKQLVLPNCDLLSADGFCGALSNWSELGDLAMHPKDIYLCGWPPNKSLPPFYFSRIMEGIGMHCKRLIKLRLLSCINLSNASEITKHIPWLKILDLSFAPISEAGFAVLLEGCRQLIHLNIAHFRSDTKYAGSGWGPSAGELQPELMARATQGLKEFIRCHPDECDTCQTMWPSLHLADVRYFWLLEGHPVSLATAAYLAIHRIGKHYLDARFIPYYISTALICNRRKIFWHRARVRRVYENTYGRCFITCL